MVFFFRKIFFALQKILGQSFFRKLFILFTEILLKSRVCAYITGTPPIPSKRARGHGFFCWGGVLSGPPLCLRIREVNFGKSSKFECKMRNFPVQEFKFLKMQAQDCCAGGAEMGMGRARSS
jgi:hypothetical protein